MIRTYSGLWVNPLKLDPNQVTIRDIAASLAKQCRFLGHISRVYTVAEHCLLGITAKGLTPIEKLAFLLHDAAEAYIGDICGPLKKYIIIADVPIAQLESHILDTICVGLRLDPIVRSTIDSDKIKQLDKAMCDLEKHIFAHDAAGECEELSHVVFAEEALDSDNLMSDYIYTFKELSREWVR